MASELLRLAQYGDNHEGGAGTAPHACDRNCHRIRRDSIAGAVLASAELCRRSTADRLYERARAAMPGQGSIERLKLRSTRTPRPFATNIWILGSVAVSKALWGRGRFLPTHRMPPATHPALVLAGILFSGMFGSGVNPDSSIEVHQVAGRESSSQILHVSVRA
jgi:hypothetical protein